MTDHITTPQLTAHYDAMWDRSIDAIAMGDIECDATLAVRPDPRRGITVIARPDAALTARFESLLDRLALVEPGQYRYPPSDMHLTVLSLCSATRNAAAQLARIDEYASAVQAALDGLPPFDIDFDGIALSRAAILARGFPRGPALEIVRERLREQLRLRGLDASLDQRYRLVTAHVTLCRFTAPLENSDAFAALLETMLNEPLGVMRVERLDLVINDWTMSSDSLKLVARTYLNRPDDHRPS